MQGVYIMSRTDSRIYGDRPRPADSYRGSRPQDATRGEYARHLKAARIRRGMTRRQLDSEREAVRRFIVDGTVNRKFTGGQLLSLVNTVAAGIM